MKKRGGKARGIVKPKPVTKTLPAKLKKELSKMKALERKVRKEEKATARLALKVGKLERKYKALEKETSVAQKLVRTRLAELELQLEWIDKEFDGPGSSSSSATGSPRT